MRLDYVLAHRKMPSKVLAERIGIAPMNISRLKTGRCKAIRFSTLDAICKELRCQPGDLIEYVSDDETKDLPVKVRAKPRVYKLDD